MSLGPGWAYTYTYLKNLLVDTYCYFYLPKNGDCVVDIGAGLGEESMIFAQLVGKHGKVFSVEANPVTFGALAYAYKKNDFTSCKPLNVALFEKNTTVTIEDDEASYIGNTVSMGSDKKSFQVRAVTFDTFVKENNINTIDFLKLNIEGAEQFLLEGSDQSIGIVKNLCISCHDFRQNYHQHGLFYVTKDKIRTFLISKGFEITSRTTGNVVIDDFLYAKT
jgi:FkbM family methyltransferase